MKLESQLIAELWVVVRDAIPTAQKHEIAMQFLKTFEDFDFSFQPSLNKDKIMELGNLRFLEEKTMPHLL